MVVVLCVTSVLLSLSDTVLLSLSHTGCCLVYDACVVSLSDAVVVVLYVTSLCCHCQTQWLLSCM